MLREYPSLNADALELSCMAISLRLRVMKRRYRKQRSLSRKSVTNDREGIFIRLARATDHNGLPTSSATAGD